jgi:hypothetical protein
MEELILQSITESVRTSEAPVPEEASAAERLSGVLAHALDALLDSYPKLVTDMVEKATDVVGGLAHTAGELLSGLFGRGADGSVDDPSVPTNIPVPTSPTPVPVGSSTAGGSLSGVSGSPGSASVLLAVLILFLSAVFQGGKLSWCCREPLKPRSAPQLAIERPG